MMLGFLCSFYGKHRSLHFIKQFHLYQNFFEKVCFSPKRKNSARFMEVVRFEEQAMCFVLKACTSVLLTTMMSTKVDSGRQCILQDK